MFCSRCGNLLNKNDRFCPKCGCLVRKEPEKIGKQKKRSVDKKWIFTSIIVFIILVCAIIFSVYRWSKNGIYTNQKKSEISQFTDEDTRLPVDPDTYGKETLEEVFVEFIQAGCDADAERLMHTLPPDMLDNILAVPVGYEDYQRVLECFENYESDMWGLLSGEWENWECRIEQIETYGAEEIKKLNADWKEQFSYSLNGAYHPEITEAKRIDYCMRLEDGHEEFGAVQVYKIDGRWYINIYSC